MRVLITSGGTKIPIDPVRSITNTSTGHFAASIAKAALKKNLNVIYLAANAAQTPFSYSFDCLHLKKETILKQMDDTINLYEKYHNHYQEIRYQTFHDYAVLLEKTVKQQKPDAVILAAAVSDYLIEDYSSEKIRSSQNVMLTLKAAPKLINQVKEWLPTVFLVGFKLLINESDEKLAAVAKESMHSNHADLIVANNLSSLQKGEHEILIVEPDGSYQKFSSKLAEEVVSRVIRSI